MGLCELCGKNRSSDMRFSVEICKPCREHFQKAILGDIDEIKYFITPGNFPNATSEAKEKIIKLFAKRYEGLTSDSELAELNEKTRKEAEKRRAEERERQRKLHEDRLNSLRYRGYEGYYEYTTVIINDGTLGGVSSHEITSKLNDLALDGWRLVSSYANELGHNSTPGSFGSSGTNSTIDEHILILERYIKL